MSDALVSNPNFFLNCDRNFVLENIAQNRKLFTLKQQGDKIVIDCKSTIWQELMTQKWEQRVRFPIPKGAKKINILFLRIQVRSIAS